LSEGMAFLPFARSLASVPGSLGTGRRSPGLGIRTGHPAAGVQVPGWACSLRCCESVAWFSPRGSVPWFGPVVQPQLVQPHGPASAACRPVFREKRFHSNIDRRVDGSCSRLNPPNDRRPLLASTASRRVRAWSPRSVARTVPAPVSLAYRPATVRRHARLSNL
jgi:hypothetical protein